MLVSHRLTALLIAWVRPKESCLDSEVMVSPERRSISLRLGASSWTVQSLHRPSVRG